MSNAQVPSYYSDPIHPTHPSFPTQKTNITANWGTFDTVETNNLICNTGAVFNDVDIVTAQISSATIDNVVLGTITDPTLIQQNTLHALTYNTGSGQIGFQPWSLIPPGAIMPYAGTGAPAGWLLCDGREVSRSVYLNLFNTIGVIYGVGNGVSSFNLPNLKGRIPAGFDASQSYYNSFGKTGGYNTHTLTIPEMPTHLHTGTTDSSGIHTHSIVDPGHSHSYFNQPNTQGTDNAFSTESAADNVNVNQTTGVSTTGITIVADGAHVHTFTSTTTGGSQPHNNLQPYLVIQYIIKF